MECLEGVGDVTLLTELMRAATLADTIASPRTSIDVVCTPSGIEIRAVRFGGEKRVYFTRWSRLDGGCNGEIVDAVRLLIRWIREIPEQLPVERPKGEPCDHCGGSGSTTLRGVPRMCGRCLGTGRHPQPREDRT